MKSLKLLQKHEPNQPWHPWSIQVELVQGCNRRCWFCAIPAMPQERQVGRNQMGLEVLEKAFTDLSEWLPKIRVEINSHGEPTLHKQFLESLRVMRSSFPKASLQLQTNSDTWYRKGTDFIDEMWDAGLDALIINCYAEGRREYFIDLLQTAGRPFVDYYFDNDGNESGNRYRKPGSQFILLWEDLGLVNETSIRGDTKRTNKRLHNSGGNRDQDEIAARTGQKVYPLPLPNKCSKVYRELILGWDGTIPICCQDWMDVNVMGNVMDTHIRDIWFSEKFHLARLLLSRRRRDLLEPCATCNDPTTRVGLLPVPQHLSWAEDDEIFRRYKAI